MDAIRQPEPVVDNQDRARIIVAGTGPAGLIAALGLAQAGFVVELIGPEASHDDRRTTALMLPALQMLERLGVLAGLRPKAAALRMMRIVDGTSRLIRSPTVTFRASEIGEEFFGLNIANSDLNAALEAAVSEHAAITRHACLVESWNIAADNIAAVLPGGATVEGVLCVAADGRSSPAREAAGIAISSRDCPQAALVVSFAHSRTHSFISTEFHTETGPFTQVPLTGDRSSLVWVVTPQQADELAGLDDAELSMKIETRMQSMLGRVSVEPGRQVYPLSGALPQRFAQNRVALVGEAAHVFPPIGAQGLNLGTRDVHDLLEILSESRADPGSKTTLAAYDRRRRPDVYARSGAVNLLNRSLLSDMLPAQMLRGAGLGVLGGVAPLRAFFMREGLKPGSGFSAVASGIGAGLRGRFRETDPAEEPRS